jgi:DNA-directed RNA polymerase subunit H
VKVSSGPFNIQGENMAKKKRASGGEVYLDHNLCPKHEKLSEEEKKGVLEQYKITIAELPSISITDQAIIKLNAKSGDVIKITRKSATCREAIFYRGVISDQ